MTTTHRPLHLSGARFTATYRLAGVTAAQAEASARAICVEQTIEFPYDLVDPGELKDHIVGRLESLTPTDDGAFEAVISYAEEVAGGELLQLFNVLFGNSSILPKVRLERFTLTPGLLAHFRGPRFGREGLRARYGAVDRPLVATALKPMGLSPAELADMAYQLALGGIDVIKDDHGLANQVFCPFEERVARCAEAVAKANAETGGHCDYMPNVSAGPGMLEARARFAKDAGAGGLLVAPGLIGWDAMRALADDDSLGLPILGHPALQGSFVAAPDTGIAHFALYGLMHRLAGADTAIFPNVGGRFAFTAEQCLSAAAGTATELGPIASIFPAPAGGMRVDRVQEMVDFYGPDVMLLIGGDLHRSDDLLGRVRRFRGLVERRL